MGPAVIATTKCGNGFGGLPRYLLQGRKDDPHPERVAWTSHAASVMRATAARCFASHNGEVCARMRGVASDPFPRPGAL
jgi:hypothetical protein